MIESVVQCRAEHDTFAAIALVAAQSDALAATEMFMKVMRHLYWEKKDLPGAVAFGRAGAQHALTAALAEADPERAAKLRGGAKGLTYDLASFTWPGWDESGIVPTPSDLVVGLDAAKANLRLAGELNRGDLPLSRAHWMLAGHCLASGDRDRAAEGYRKAERHAIAAGSMGDQWLCAGFLAIVELLQEPSRIDAREHFADAIEQLKPLEDGAMFAGQIETAARAFGVSGCAHKLG